MIIMDTVYVTMFGGLSVTCGGKVIVENTTKTNKPLEFLALLLLLRSRENLTNEQLMDALWSDEDGVENPAGALKNVAYSVRKLLRAIDENVQFILVENGRYRWNKDVPVSLDIGELEKTAAILKNSQMSAQQQLESCERAVEVYTGDLLPGMDRGAWLMQYVHYYHRLYLDIVYSMCEMLQKYRTRRTDEAIITVCNRAAFLEPVSEKLYIFIFEAMRRLNMKEAIINYYSTVSNLFYDELGEQLCPQIVNIYRWASEGNVHFDLDLRHIQQDLSEATRDDKPIHGAYFCQYEMFKHVYHMVARSADRVGNTNVLMLLTLVAPGGKMPAKDKNITAMMLLKDMIGHVLRKGDVFSRYSRNQYILMLSVTQQKDVEVVQQRIRKAYDGLPALCTAVELDIRTLALESITLHT